MRSSPKSPFRIAIIPADGGEPRWVTPESQSSLAPRWSPDGREIAFVTMVKIDSPQELFVVSLGDGQIRRVGKSASHQAGFSHQFLNGYAWALDGRHFLYFDQLPRPEPGYGHYFMDLSGSVIRTPVAIPINSMFAVEWSADQAHVTFTGGDPHDIYIAGGHGENPRSIVAATMDRQPQAPSFSPDGQTLLYCFFQRPTKGPTLWSIGTDGKSNRSLAADGIRGQYSPDGRWIAYLDGRGTDSPDNPAGSSFFLRVIKARPDGSGAVVLAR